MKIMENKEHWNKVAKEHKDYKTLTLNDHNQRMLEIDFIRDNIPELPLYLKILEVGCGNGYSTGFFTTPYYNVTAIDKSSEMIDRAKKEKKSLKNANFIEMDVLNMEFQDNSFDVVISQRCLINLKSWNDQKTAISEIHRVLKPSGVFILLEGSETGLNNLNEMRKLVGLQEIQVSSYNINFKDRDLIEYIISLYGNVPKIKSFGVYDFITRLFHPYYVKPNDPKYKSKINKIAREMEMKLKNDTYMPNISRLIGVVVKK